jgi:hypothetical protein
MLLMNPAMFLMKAVVSAGLPARIGGEVLDHAFSLHAFDIAGISEGKLPIRHAVLLCGHSRSNAA